jgi:hypothetical protein
VGLSLLQAWQHLLTEPAARIPEHNQRLVTAEPRQVDDPAVEVWQLYRSSLRPDCRTSWRQRCSLAVNLATVGAFADGAEAGSARRGLVNIATRYGSSALYRASVHVEILAAR